MTESKGLVTIVLLENGQVAVGVNEEECLPRKRLVVHQLAKALQIVNSLSGKIIMPKQVNPFLINENKIGAH